MPFPGNFPLHQENDTGISLYFDESGAFLREPSQKPQIFADHNRNYVVVDPTIKSARSFQLPLEDPCYYFQFFDPSFQISISGFSCDLEKGGATTYPEIPDRVYLGYGTQLWGLDLPH